MATELKSVTKKKGDKECRITVEQIENGYLIIKTTEGQGKNGWEYDCKKLYSKDNPLDFKENKALADLID